MAAVGVLSRHAGAAVGVAHCSSPAVVALIERERAAGARVAAEACPQYFLLREQDIDEHGALRKFTPPARARIDADEDEMWRLLRDGSLSFLSSDHAPSTREQKLGSSIWQCHFGLPGLDTTMPLLLDAAARGKLAYEDVVRVYSAAPARHYGLWPRKGALEEGADADLALVDPSAAWTLGREHVLSKAGWTPYEGREVRGRVVRTLLRGETVARAGRRALRGALRAGRRRLAGAVTAAVQLADLLRQLGHRTLDGDAGGDLLDRQRPHRTRRDAHLGEPAGRLRRGAHVDDPAEPDPRVGG